MTSLVRSRSSYNVAICTEGGLIYNNKRFGISGFSIEMTFLLSDIFLQRDFDKISFSEQKYFILAAFSS